MRVGVISDTHGLLRPEAEELLAGCGHIIHAGDIGAPDIVPRLQALAPVTAIRGNVDRDDWAAAFPEAAEVTLGEHRIHVLHDRAARDFDPVAAGIGIVIAGHSHSPSIERMGPVLHINPGSAGRRRFSLPVTIATLQLMPGSVEARIHELAV